jgi:hypothetical protein
MAQTFDTSRVGGGTYELELDSTGNYKLKSVGFEAVDKLNLPDLKTSDTSVADTTKKATEDTIKTQTTEVFKPMNTYGESGEDNQSNTSTPMLKTAKVKVASPRDVLDPRDTRSPTDIQNLQTAQQNYKDASVAYRSDAGSPADKTKMDAANNTIMDARQNYGATTQYNTPKTTGLQKVQSAVKNTVSNVVDSVKDKKPFRIAGPLTGIANLISAMAPEKTVTQKVNEDYFNVKENGRIAGNPTTDVFAGMNAVSAFGNISEGAQKRLDTRQKTIDKKGYKPGDKFFDDTEKMKNDKQNYDNAKNTAKEKSKTASQKSTNPNKRSGANSGGNGSDSGRVICTDLHRTGELSTRDWIRDTKFTFKTLSITHVKGYLLWAEPTVRHIQKYPRYRKIWKHIAQHRANDIAWRLNEGKFDLLGRIYAGIGEPVCWALGNFVSDKQISKYNLTHWRRA